MLEIQNDKGAANIRDRVQQSNGVEEAMLEYEAARIADQCGSDRVE
jgi:hypothetical protein